MSGKILCKFGLDFGQIWGSFLDILSSSPAEDRRVYFEGLMALQLELQKKALFNTNAGQLTTLDNVGESASKMDDEEEVCYFSSYPSLLLTS